MTRGQQLAVAITCLVASVTYAGAVTTWAMGLFVLPGVAVAALLASLLAARRMSGMAIGVVGALVLGWAELANIWTGTANGPAARSTALAAGCTVIAVVLAHSRWPALFLAGVAGVVAGAVVLGAAGEVRIVVVAAAVCAALTLGWIERSRRNWTARPRRGIALVLLSLLAGAAAAGAVLLQAQEDPRDPALVTLQGRQYPGIKPAWTDPLDNGFQLARPAPPPGTARTQSRRRRDPPTAHLASREQLAKHANPSHPAPVQKHSSRSIWFYVVAALLLVLLILAVLIAARLLSTRFAWGRVRRRLAAGAPADQITGAWAWTRMRLEACRLPLSVDVSPDMVVARHALLAGELKLVAEELADHGYPTADVPTDVYTPLQALAATTTTAAFAPEQSLGAPEVAAAWTAADKAYESARELLSRSGRALLAFRGPVLAALSEDEDAAPRSRRVTTTQAAIIMVTSGLVLCSAILAGFGVFGGKSAVRIVSTLTKPATAAVSTSTPPVSAPTTPGHVLVPRAQAPFQTLAPGAAGSQVKIVQGALAALPATAAGSTSKADAKAPTTPQAQAPSQTLAPGDTGPQVTILQRALAALGLSAGTPDGNYGPATQTAVARFQASKGLLQVGIVGPQTLAALQHALRDALVPPAQAPSQTLTPGAAGSQVKIVQGALAALPATAAGSTSRADVKAPTTPRAQAPSQTLAPGDTGPQVTILQRALAALGLSAGTPDGNYGPATQTAVARFQASKGLPQVGIVGPQTLAALQQALSRRSKR